MNNCQKYSSQKQKGYFAEEFARLFLIEKGHDVLQKNFCGRGFEIDVISRDGEHLVATEVKFRYALRSVSNAQCCELFPDLKRKRLYAGLDVFARNYEWGKGAKKRVDGLVLSLNSSRRFFVVSYLINLTVSL